MVRDRHELYRVFAENGDLLYVGISLSVIERLRQHRQGGAEWFAEAAVIRIERHVSRADCMAAEAAAIATEQPRYNIAHKSKKPIPKRPERITDPLLLRDCDGRLVRFLCAGDLAGVLGVSAERARALRQEPTFPRSCYIGTGNRLFWRAHQVEIWAKTRVAIGASDKAQVVESG